MNQERGNVLYKTAHSKSFIELMFYLILDILFIIFLTIFILFPLPPQGTLTENLSFYFTYIIVIFSVALLTYLIINYFLTYLIIYDKGIVIRKAIKYPNFKGKFIPFKEIIKFEIIIENDKDNQKSLKIDTRNNEIIKYKAEQIKNIEKVNKILNLKINEIT